MKRARKFLNLSVREKFLLMEAVTLVLAIRVGLNLLPFSTLRMLLRKGTKNHVEHECKRRFSIDQVAWSVAAANHYVPKATCLTDSLSLQVLLHHEGYPASVQIGVMKDEKGQFEAHAWVESQGKVVNSGSKIGQYKSLLFQYDKE